jgi:riboflavin kinase/FMN adenylyltransferase
MSAARTISPADMPANLPAAWRGAVVAIGNFDGVHRGHQAVLAAARAHAEHRGVPCLMLTFEPHPRAYFSGRDVFRLTPLPLKAALAAALGMDGTLVLPFDAGLRRHERRTLRRRRAGGEARRRRGGHRL